MANGEVPIDHVANRAQLVAALRAELLGPQPVGDPIDTVDDLIFPNAADAYRPRHDAATGEEILQRDPPTRRYGIGVLFPLGADDVDEDIPQALEPAEPTPPLLSDSAARDIEAVRDRDEGGDEIAVDDDTTDLDLSGANAYKPTSMAVSFLLDTTRDGELQLSLRGARYRRKDIHVAERARTWWIRQPLAFDTTIPFGELTGAGIKRPTRRALTSAFDRLDIRFEVFSRPHAENARLVTVCVVNRTPIARPVDELSLFQTGFTASGRTASGSSILPYPSSRAEALDEEEQGLALLYRDVQTFAVGHGCAADWVLTQDRGRAEEVSATSVPVFETPSTTPDIKVPGTRENLVVEMQPLAGLVPDDDGFAALDGIVQLYEQWMRDRHTEAEGLPQRYRAAAERHLIACDAAARRMHRGLAYLRENPQARRAFQLANHAILLQQVNSGRALRTVSQEAATRRLVIAPGYTPPDTQNLSPHQGKWRPFQIAFLLMSIQSAVDGNSPDRRTVELIWFPTGGGKTEAYLGLTAFTIFMRRLANRDDSGTSVLMRYTLRLLTAQQFQRACRLVSAMEWLRRREPESLGRAEVSIGIWLGGATTPNTKSDALAMLRKLQRDPREDNRFLLDQCPWCRVPLGIVAGAGAQRARQRRGNRANGDHLVVGYEQRGNTVAFACPDVRCPFSGGLPIVVVDEDIYERPPSVLIGTVDKFAVLAWKDGARSIFGIGRDGNRTVSPPSLIIQDELHLISGPLGSMVGLYEVLVEELCTDRRADTPVAPKIVCSTATIRRYEAQVLALYNRDSVTLFPPPGLKADDSFFARYATREDDSPEPGRLYLGVHGPALGSLQTVQVRTLAASLQSAQPLTPPERDPWWTLMIFFNSLRELGGTLSLIQSDIPDHLRIIKNRLGLDWPQVRQLRHVEELTSRLRSQEVPQAIAKLEVPTTAAVAAVDICLASNIIEVGVDIDRLSLMAVVGQPKTTSQYIQVTGRVGRRWWERPGLVIAIYAATKARDRSHFEKFRSYHERLYAQVEPTSVTPFSRPVLERALHAIMVAYVRQTGNAAVTRAPMPFPGAFVARIRDLIVARVADVDPEEALTLEAVFARREQEWQAWEPRVWSGAVEEEDMPLLRMAGTYADPRLAVRSWPTPNSLRNVDAECQAEITDLYGNIPAAAGEQPAGVQPVL